MTIFAGILAVILADKSEFCLQAHQYLADANEAETWMAEKEPIVGSGDYGKDEDR